MYTLLKPIKVREELLKRGVRIFTPQIFAQIFNVNPTVTKHFLETQTQDGFLMRYKRGLYTIKSDQPSEEEIANRLYQPSYISFEYALAYHNVLSEMPYVITSATTKPTRLFTTSSLSFAYYSIKPEFYTGYSLVKTDTKSFIIADPEKALADYLYFMTLGKRPPNDRLILKNINKNKLMAYTKLYKRANIIRLVKATYATL
jgi:predicted transcriptional regulator of viral defense system